MKASGNKVTIFCSGGCGRSVTLRASKITECDFYLCDSKESKRECVAALPKKPDEFISVYMFNAAAHFSGISYRLPNEEEKRSVARATALRDFALEKLPKNNVEYKK